MSIIINKIDGHNILYTKMSRVLYEDLDTMLPSRHKDTITLTDTIAVKLHTLRDFLNSIRVLMNLTQPTHIRVNVNSGYRTPKINRLVGGSRTSQHMQATAMDLSFTHEDGTRCSHRELQAIAAIILKHYGNTIRQIIVYKTFIHIGLATEDNQHLHTLRKGL